MNNQVVTSNETSPTAASSAAHFAQLMQQLSQFGLNPLDWTLFTRQENSYELSHREHSSFRMSMIVESLCNGFVRVDHLSVISI